MPLGLRELSTPARKRAALHTLPSTLLNSPSSTAHQHPTKPVQPHASAAEMKRATPPKRTLREETEFLAASRADGGTSAAVKVPDVASKRCRSTPSGEARAGSERAALAGLISAGLLSVDHIDSGMDKQGIEMVELCRAHGRMLRLSREPHLIDFVMRLAAAVEDGALTFAAASDLIVDVGLQAKMREVLGCFEHAWLVPAMAVVLGCPVTTSVRELTAAFAGRFPCDVDRELLRRALLRRIFCLLVLLDEAASMALLPPRFPALFVAGCPYNSSEKLLHHVQRTFLGNYDTAVEAAVAYAKHMQLLGHQG